MIIIDYVLTMYVIQITGPGAAKTSARSTHRNYSYGSRTMVVAATAANTTKGGQTQMREGG